MRIVHCTTDIALFLQKHLLKKIVDIFAHLYVNFFHTNVWAICLCQFFFYKSHTLAWSWAMLISIRILSLKE